MTIFRYPSNDGTGERVGPGHGNRNFAAALSKGFLPVHHADRLLMQHPAPKELAKRERDGEKL